MIWLGLIGTYTGIYNKDVFSQENMQNKALIHRKYHIHILTATPPPLLGLLSNILFMTNCIPHWRFKHVLGHNLNLNLYYFGPKSVNLAVSLVTIPVVPHIEFSVAPETKHLVPFITFDVTFHLAVWGKSLISNSSSYFLKVGLGCSSSFSSSLTLGM